jgi:hypothetical protein
MSTAIGLLIFVALFDCVVRFYGRVIRAGFRLCLAAANKVRGAR